MLAEDRRKRILQTLAAEGSVTVDALADQCGVSTMTVWRDLKTLEDAGHLRRVHGGAVRVGGADAEPAFGRKQGVAQRQKEQIASYAARHLVEDGDILILEGGTTVAAMVPHLKNAGLTILTNGLDVLAQAARRLSEITVLSCGGMLREQSHTLVGPQAEAFFDGFKGDKFFLSATGLTLTEGLTDPNPLEIQIKQAMSAHVRQRIVLVDSTKFSVRSLATVLPLAAIDILVTDADAPAETIATLRKHGIDVRIAGADQV